MSKGKNIDLLLKKVNQKSDDRPRLFRIAAVPESLNILLRGQLAYLNQYYRVSGISSPGPALEEVEKREGIEVKSIRIARHIHILKDLRSLVSLYLYFRKERPAIIHSITPKAGLLSMAAGYFAGVPHRIHTFTGLIFPSRKGLMHYLLKNMDRLTCHLATCVIPEGEGVKRTLLREKITKKSLAVILNGNINGIDLDYFRRSADVKIKAAALRKKAFTFCYVGRMTRDKGINELIRAFAELSETFPEVHLVLVGPLEQELDPISETALELIQNHPAITFTGFQEDVRPFLAASDAFVFPSYREGFPNVVIQAGAMGLPSIVTDINGSNEIIIQGQNGIIIPPKDQHTLLDAMMYFAEHQDIVTTMAASCRPLIASRYEQKMVWEAILRMYQSLDNEK